MADEQVGKLNRTLEQIQIEQQRLAKLEEHFRFVISYYESLGDESEALPRHESLGAGNAAGADPLPVSVSRDKTDLPQKLGDRDRKAASGLLSVPEDSEETKRRASEILRNNEIRVRQQAVN